MVVPLSWRGDDEKEKKMARLRVYCDCITRGLRPGERRGQWGDVLGRGTGRRRRRRLSSSHRVLRATEKTEEAKRDQVETVEGRLGVQRRVAYQGIPGAYSEGAAIAAYGSNCELVPCESFEKCFDMVEQWLSDRAVLPIENSLGGSIHRNYDLLLNHNLHIVGEVSVPVRHCLLAKQGVTVDAIKRVMSHPQALAQCDKYLTNLGVEQVQASDTALSGKKIAGAPLGEMEDVAAVASRRAAELYELDVLDFDIQDDGDNVTRFLALARDPIPPTSDVPYKTSIIFSLAEGAGVLFKALSVFALRDIDLTKIESRPTPAGMVPIVELATGKERRFKYIFHVDFAASIGSKNVQNALRHLGEMAPFLRVLGSYPRDLQMGKIDS